MTIAIAIAIIVTAFAVKVAVDAIRDARENRGRERRRWAAFMAREHG